MPLARCTHGLRHIIQLFFCLYLLFRMLALCATILYECRPEGSAAIHFHAKLSRYFWPANFLTRQNHLSLLNGVAISNKPCRSRLQCTAYTTHTRTRTHAFKCINAIPRGVAAGKPRSTASYPFLARTQCDVNVVCQRKDGIILICHRNRILTFIL